MPGWVKRGDEPLRMRGRKLQEARARLFSANPLCPECEARGTIRLATQRDHIIPLSQGGQDIESNTQGLCDACHARKSFQESQARPLSSEAQERRLPSHLKRSCVPLTIVCGPPGSGKSSYVKEHASPNDLVIDLDTIEAPSLAEKLDKRNAMLRSLADSEHKRAWFIVGAAEPSERAAWIQRLGGTLITLNTPLAECIRRIKSERKEQEQSRLNAAQEWWRINTDHPAPRPTIGRDGYPIGGGD